MVLLFVHILHALLGTQLIFRPFQQRAYSDMLCGGFF